MTINELMPDDTFFTPYHFSQVVHNITQNIVQNHTPRLAFVDIDTTFTGKSSVIKKTREKLEALGFSLVFVSSRTEELMMSQKAYEKSLSLGFSRPKPLIKKKKGQFAYEDPSIYQPQLVDPDIIVGSTGTQILIKNKDGGYTKDLYYEKQFADFSWRKEIITFLKSINSENLFSFSPIESEENYFLQKTDVFPPLYRIQISFPSLENKLFFYEILQEKYQEIAKRIHISDDSYPKMKKFTIYITPSRAHKTRAVEHIVSSLCTVLAKPYKLHRKDFEVLLAGDSWQDLSMLLYGARGTAATSILVGGSRLSNALLDTNTKYFAGENLSRIKNGLVSLAENMKGHYSFIFEPIQQKVELVRNFIIGDSAFPKTQGPETILAYLESLER